MSAPRALARSGFAALGLLAAAVPAAQAVDVTLYDPRSLHAPPLGTIPAVHPERFVLPNGGVVFLLEDHALPVVRGIAYFPSSPSLVPANRAGLAAMTGEVMRSGGTTVHPGDWLDDHLAAIGASLTSRMDRTLGTTEFRCLAENTGEVLALWADLVRRPAFPDDKLELSKVGQRQAIASRNDDLMNILFRVSAQAVYGNGSPWVVRPEYATIEPITRRDLQKLHDQVFVPERMIGAIYGDFRAADLKARLREAFGEWKPGGTPRPLLPPTAREVTPKLWFAPKEDVTQAGIVLAQPGSRADDPDYASLQVLEQGLGGGFSSRLMNHIREQRGLAYSTGAQAGSDFPKPGIFLAYSLTKSESTMTAFDLVRREVKDVTVAPFSDAELASAKQAVQNGFVFNFEDPSQTLFRAAYYEAVGYPADFLQRYQRALDRVTPGSVLEAARRKITPDRQVAIIVGREKDFDRPLASAGLPVERVDLAIPPPDSTSGAPGGATGAPPWAMPAGTHDAAPGDAPGAASQAASAEPGAAPAARAWLEAAAKAAGGPAAWAAVRTVTIGTEGTIQMAGKSLRYSGEESWRFPDHQLARQKLPFGEVTQGFDGQAGWLSAMGQLQDNPPAAEEVARDFERSPWHLFADPSSIDAVAFGKPDTVEGVGYRSALVRGSRLHELTLLFGPGGRLAGIAYQDEGQGQVGPARVVELMTDWRPEGALLYPHGVRILREGKLVLEGSVTSIKLNPALPEDAFKKPAAH